MEEKEIMGFESYRVKNSNTSSYKNYEEYIEIEEIYKRVLTKIVGHEGLARNFFKVMGDKWQ